MQVWQFEQVKHIPETLKYWIGQLFKQEFIYNTVEVKQELHFEDNWEQVLQLFVHELHLFVDD